jgi:hypothetical protein
MGSRRESGVGPFDGFRGGRERGGWDNRHQWRMGAER